MSFRSDVSTFKKPSVISKFSPWSKLYRVITWRIGFKCNFSKVTVNRFKSYLSTEEISKAITVVMKIVQQSSFPEGEMHSDCATTL